MDPLEVHDVGIMDPESAEAFLDAVAAEIQPDPQVPPDEDDGTDEEEDEREGVQTG